MTITLKQKVLISLSELIGFIWAIIPTVWIIIQGGVIEDTFTGIALTTLRLALYLRKIHLFLVIVSTILLLTLIILLCYLLLLRQKISTLEFSSSRWIAFRVLTGVFIGYILGKILFFYLLNSIFYRNVFVTVPFLFGSLLLIGVIILVFGNPEFTPFLIYLKNQNHKERPQISRIRLVGAITKTMLFFLIAMLLVIPNFLPLLGYYPTPPKTPGEPYLDQTNLFTVDSFKFQHTLPDNITSLVKPDNPDGKWYIYIYLPNNGASSNVQYPVALYLHGYSGTDINLYKSSLKTLAARGVISIFVQYATYLNLKGSYLDVPFTNPADNPELAVRYTMEWSGIIQAINTLNLSTTGFTSEMLQSHLGSNFTIDMSRLMIVGHSMGGGMVPYITTKSLQQGWGSSKLILDMEAPWYSSTWPGFTANYSLFPNYTLLNVATFEDDHLVSQCIGMNFFENIRSGAHLNDIQLDFIYIHSDFHGFPRLLASHYLPIDPVDDALHEFGYTKRIQAMAFYLFESSFGSTQQLIQSLQYFLGGEVQNMGKWSDGVAVQPAYTTSDPYGIRGSPSLVNQLQHSDNEFCNPNS